MWVLRASLAGLVVAAFTPVCRWPCLTGAFCRTLPIIPPPVSLVPGPVVTLVPRAAVVVIPIWVLRRYLVGLVVAVFTPVSR